LSLPIVVGVLAVYIVVQFACLLVAIGLKAATWDDFGGGKQETTATMPADGVGGPEVSTLPVTTLPSVATGTSTGTAPETMPAGAKVKTGAERMVLFNEIGVATYALTIIPVLIGLWFLFPDRFKGLGLSLGQLASAWRGAVGFVVYYPIWLLGAFGIGIIYSFFRVEVQDHATLQALEQLEHHPNVVAQWILILSAAVVAPFAEELFFRGILQTTLVQRGFGFLLPQLMRVEGRAIPYTPPAWHRWLAIVVTSVAFACVHEWDAAPMIFVLSLGLGYVYERTGNLWASMTFHFLFNVINIWSFVSGMS